MALLFLAPALYNGYPLVFSDTVEYVWAAAYSGVPALRPIGYGVFMRLTGLRLSLWPTAGAQALLTALTLWVTFRSYRPRHPARWLLGIGAALTLGSALPWFAAQVMPDFLTPLAVLAAFVLVVRWRQSAPWARAAAAGVLTLACAAHSSNVLLTGALAGLVLLWGVVRRERRWLPAALRAAAPLAVASVLVLAINYRQTGGEVFLTRGGHVFMLGRLAESQILQRLLADRCPAARYALCPYRAEIPDSLELFMFDPDSTAPLNRVGGHHMPARTAMPMVRDAVRYYPGAVVGSSLRNSARQFVTFRTGDGLRPYRITDPRFKNTPEALRAVFPREYPQFVAARQQQATLPVGVFRGLNAAVTWPALAGSAVLMLGGLAARRPRDATRASHPTPSAADARAADLHAWVWIGAALNATICATLSTVTDRFQARVVWLFVFAALVTIALGVEGGRRRRPAAEAE